MKLIASFLICVFTLAALPASAGSEIRVVRHRGYESWKRFNANIERTEATTRLLEERAKTYALEREIEREHLEILRDQANPPGERTLGRACIYGRNDEVLYQPEGKSCSRALR